MFTLHPTIVYCLKLVGTASWHPLRACACLVCKLLLINVRLPFGVTNAIDISAGPATYSLHLQTCMRGFKAKQLSLAGFERKLGTI